MLKSLKQQQNSSISGAQSGQETPQFDVFELANNVKVSQTSLMLKLTDESCEAIRNAAKSKSPIRMKIVNGVATLEIGNVGDGNYLTFKCSLQNQPPTDVIAYDNKQKIYKNIGIATSVKMQIQATDKTFAELKEKTQRIIEEDQQKKPKEMPKAQRTSVKQHSKNHFGGIGFQTKNHAKKTPTNTILSKFAQSSTSKRPYSPSPTINHFNTRTSTKQPRSEEGTGIGTSPSFMKNEAMKQPKIDPSIKRIEEKSSKQDRTNEASLAFTKMESYKKEKDLFYIPKRKVPNRSISPASTTTSTPKTISPPLAMARPPSVDSTQLQNGSSSSRDYNTTNGDEQGSMTLPIKPTKDWSLEFGKIENQEQASRYHERFKAEYPEYRKCYEALECVADEFRELKATLNQTVDNFKRGQIEKEIKSKFAGYQSDQEFLRKRQKHHDLRCKLDVIKQALSQWAASPVRH